MKSPRKATITTRHAPQNDRSDNISRFSTRVSQPCKITIDCCSETNIAPGSVLFVSDEREVEGSGWNEISKNELSGLRILNFVSKKTWNPNTLLREEWRKEAHQVRATRENRNIVLHRNRIKFKIRSSEQVWEHLLSAFQFYSEFVCILGQMQGKVGKNWVMKINAFIDTFYRCPTFTWSKWKISGVKLS